MNQRERDIMQIVAGLFVVGIVLGLIFSLTGCTRLSVEAPNGVKGSYTTFEPLRLRNSQIRYSPETGVIEVDVSRQNAISADIINSAVKAGASAAKVAM
jgi:hypothetical protein